MKLSKLASPSSVGNWISATMLSTAAVTCFLVLRTQVCNSKQSVVSLLYYYYYYYYFYDVDDDDDNK